MNLPAARWRHVGTDHKAVDNHDTVQFLHLVVSPLLEAAVNQRFHYTSMHTHREIMIMPSVLWYWWLGIRKRTPSQSPMLCWRSLTNPYKPRKWSLKQQCNYKFSKNICSKKTQITPRHQQKIDALHFLQQHYFQSNKKHQKRSLLDMFLISSDE